MRTETRSITIEATPSAVFDYVADPRTLPAWAPAFAQTVRPEGSHWVVNDEALIDVIVSRSHGTVDIVSAADPRRGVFTRVLANGDGSEYLFTQFFPDGTPEEAVARQVEVVENELGRVRDAVSAIRPNP
jgi:uncharacterized protein YndB with AHSA1/START domain